MSAVSPEISKYFEARLPDMTAAVQQLASIESPSLNIDALTHCADALAAYIVAMTGVTPKIILDGDNKRPHVRVDFGERTDVLFIGHFDTVHPLGTVNHFPVHLEGHKLHGPGALDMKGGLVIMVEAARYLLSQDKHPNLTMFFNSDEELGSQSSSPYFRAIVPEAKAILVFDYGDPSGAVRNASRGVRHITVTVEGKGGHAAYPERNNNPVDGLADIIVAARRYHHPDKGIVVIPTVLSASDKTNVVPDSASVSFDIRGKTDEQLEEAQKGIERLHLAEHGLTVTSHLDVGVNAFHDNDDNYAVTLLQKAADQLGLPEPKLVESRGASDANQIADLNPSVLDGLGGWGDGAHSGHREYLDVNSLPVHATLASAVAILGLSED